MFRCYLLEGQTETDKNIRKLVPIFHIVEIQNPDLEGSMGVGVGALWFSLQSINQVDYLLQLEKSIFSGHFFKVVTLYRKFTRDIVLHTVKCHPQRIGNIELRTKTVRQKKGCLRRCFLKLASKTGLFCHFSSYGICFHFYISCPLWLKSKQSINLELPIKCPGHIEGCGFNQLR